MLSVISWYRSLGTNLVPDESITVEPAAVVRRVVSHPFRLIRKRFYRTIIENNLFRPLGWIPPRPQEPYRLLGTIISTDTSTPPKAIIQYTVGNQTHIITIGDILDTDTLVTDIQTKYITLKKNGQRRQLTLKSSFLQRR